MNLDQLRQKMKEPGLVVSGAAHVALLVAALVAFSSTQKFSDAQEAIPVEMVSQSELNEIMKGEKTAKDVKPAPRKAEKAAEAPAPKPQPETPEAKADTPAPPPLRRAPEPVAEEARPKQEKPAPAKAVTPPARPRSEPVKTAQANPLTPAPPTRPEPVKAAPPKTAAAPAAEPDPPEDPDNPMVVRPVPRVVKPDPPKAEAPKTVAAATPPAPAPPKRVRPAEKPPASKAEPLKLDEVAKYLDQKKAQVKPDVPSPPPAAAQPAPTQARTFDPSSIKDIINHDKPKHAPAAAPEVTQTASIGAPKESAAKMSVSMADALGSLMMEQYSKCWTDNGIEAHGYAPIIRVQYAPDGSLIGAPSLTNPPSDPVLQGLADDALRAIRKCNPLKIPAQYAPYYEQWKQWRLRMNPEDRTG